MPMDEAEIVENARVALAKVEAIASAALAQSEAIPFVHDPQKALAIRRTLLLLEELQGVAIRTLQVIEPSALASPHVADRSAEFRVRKTRDRK